MHNLVFQSRPIEANTAEAEDAIRDCSEMFVPDKGLSFMKGLKAGEVAKPCRVHVTSGSGTVGPGRLVE